MDVAEASFTGTLRIIAILLLVWFVLRLLRARRTGADAGRGYKWVPRDQRPKGEVSIERTEESEKAERAKDIPISDADYEEIK